MYKPTSVPWIVDLDDQGRLIRFVSTSSGGRRDRGKVFVVPSPGVRTSAIEANLLVDKAEYVLGLERDAKSAARHEAYVKLLRKCAEATGERDILLVLQFVQKFDPAAADLPEKITPESLVGFRVDGRFPHDSPSVQRFWAQHFALQQGSKIDCIVCGTSCIPVSRHPGNIKGIPGGQPSGMALISANEAAFESYGLEKSVIAPTCSSCAEKYLIAANDLIQNEQTHIRVGPLLYLFWTREKAGFSPVSLFTKPQPQEVKTLIASAWKGREYSSLDENLFYATALSASGGRVAVRDWLETTVGNVRTNLARWFVLQEIVDWKTGEDGDPYGLYSLCASLYRDANREMVANVPKTLLGFALHGGQLPKWLLFQAVRRNRAEQGVTRSRMALIKMVLLSEAKGREETLRQLETENVHPAYLCGRLFAVLEAAQRTAMPKINATIADRFFGTASSAPASVFGRLLRGAQSHLGKLRREKRGAYIAIQERLEEIQSKLRHFPAVLSLEEQGLFALGYYHQKAADRLAARNKKADQNQIPDEGEF